MLLQCLTWLKFGLKITHYSQVIHWLPNLHLSEPANYRPISNLNNISQIIERLILTRLQPHIISSPNFNLFQSAYRPYHSTETSLVHLLVYHAADDGLATLLLYLSTVFATIDHSILLKCLSNSVVSALCSRGTTRTVGTSRTKHVVWKRFTVRLVPPRHINSGENSSPDSVVLSTWGSPNTDQLPYKTAKIRRHCGAE